MSGNDSRPRPLYPRDGTMVREAGWEATCRGSKHSTPEAQPVSPFSIRFTNTFISGSPLLKCVYVSLKDGSLLEGYRMVIKKFWNQNHRHFRPEHLSKRTQDTLLSAAVTLRYTCCT
jgi:hypothetical protein